MCKVPFTGAHARDSGVCAEFGACADLGAFYFEFRRAGATITFPLLRLLPSMHRAVVVVLVFSTLSLYVEAAARMPVVRCFADPVDAFEEFRECYSCDEPRYTTAYIEFYRTGILMESASGRALPANRTLCVDFLEDCSCCFTPTAALCDALDANFTVGAGDSMMSTLMHKFKKICGRSDVFVNIFPSSGYFIPTNTGHMTLLHDTVVATKPKVVFLNYAFHFLSLRIAREIPRDVFLHYETTIGRVLESIRTLAPEARVIWMLTNSICVGKYNGPYRRAIDMYRRGNRTWFADGGDWRTVALSAFDRDGARLLNNRAELFLREHHPHVRIVDGFAATDFMCDYTTVTDGRHFVALRPLKLDLFFHAVRRHIANYGVVSRRQDAGER